MDDAYARRTPFGEPVVHGMAVILAALAAWGKGRPFALTSLKAQFRGPVFTDDDVEMDVAERDQDVSIRIRVDDALKMTIDFGWLRPTTAEGDATEDRRPFVPRTAAAEFTPPQAPARRQGLGYRSDVDALAGSTAPFAAARALIPRAQLEALLWSSYVIGMEIPGRQALFTECQITFDPRDAFAEPDLDVTHDARFGVVTLRGSGPGLTAVTLRATARPERPRLEPPQNAPDRSFEGKAAAITGSSRGFGAALALALAARGSGVVLTARTEGDDLEEVADAARKCGVPVAAAIGDLRTAAGCARLRAVTETAFGRVDYLICSASGPIRKAPAAELTPRRLAESVEEAIELVRGPVLALRPLLRDGATVVCISSEWVSAPPAGFAHYAAAKGAVEGLARGLAAEWPALRFVVARPPRMLTDQTNTSGLPQHLESPAVVAAGIVSSLAALHDRSGFHILPASP